MKIQLSTEAAEVNKRQPLWSPLVTVQAELIGPGPGSLWLQLVGKVSVLLEVDLTSCFFFQMVEMVCLHVISLMEALQECNSTIFVKVGKSHDFYRLFLAPKNKCGFI